MPSLRFAPGPIVLAFLTLALPAQTGDAAKARRAEAEAAWARLEARAAKLPPVPARDIKGPPAPDIETLRLGRDAQGFARLNEDQPEAFSAWVLAARTSRIAGDPVVAVELLGRAVQALAPAGRTPGARAPGGRGKDSPSATADPRLIEEKARLDAEAAGILADFGDLAGAVTRITAALEARPSDPRARDWSQKKSEWDQAAAEQEAQLGRILEWQASPEASARLSAAHAARFFVATWPLHPKSAPLLEGIRAALPENAEASARPLVEALALYHPAAAGVAALVPELAASLANEGEYEKALLQAQRMLDRSELLPAAAVGNLQALAGQLETRLDRIAARGLPAGRRSKSARIPVLREAIRLAEDPVLVGQALQALVEDYPTAPEIPGLRLDAGRSLLVHAPEIGSEILQGLVKDQPETAPAFAAAELLAQRMESDEGPEAALEWLNGAAPRLADPRRRAALDLRRAALLEKLERLDEARAALEPHLALADAELAPRIKKLAEELDRRLAEGR